MKLFTKWAGKNTLILTWSNTDLYTLMDNCRLFLGSREIPFLHRYADLQAYVQKKIKWNAGNQLGLSAAAEAMNVSSEDIDLHRAMGDSLLCARILQKCYDKEEMSVLIQDGDAPDFYDRFLFKPYPITDLKSPFVHAEDLQFTCIRCEKALKRNRGWRRCNRAVESEFSCKDCGGKFTGRVQFLKQYDSVMVTKTLLEIDPNAKPTPKGKPAKKPVKIEKSTETVSS